MPKPEILSFSRGIINIPHIQEFLDASVVRHFAWMPRNVTKVVGWGRKASGRRAQAFAEKHGIDALYLEDGFLRSIGLGVSGEPPISLVVDDLGIYYDASVRSRLELLIASCRGLSIEENEAVRRAISLIRAHRLSKYNDGAANIVLPSDSKRRILVVDQTFDDKSVLFGGGCAKIFESMLVTAQKEHPDADIWVKAHPDVVAGKRAGYLNLEVLGPNTRVIEEQCCVISLLEQFEKVYVVTSQLGFEALMLGKAVVVFGLPWYAGWGLTDDRHKGIRNLMGRRPAPRTLEQLFFAAYFRYARYIDPVTGKRTTLFAAIDWLSRNKALRGRIGNQLVFVGMSYWKRAVLRNFFYSRSLRTFHVRKLTKENLTKLPVDARLVFWGDQQEEARAEAIRLGRNVMRVEDGFIRSAGLGSDLHAPLSLTVDSAGIYYDPHSGSLLETLLNQAQVTEKQRLRARALIRTIRALRISKYNVGSHFTPNCSSIGKRIILVPGQVEDDASIKKGASAISTNIALLEAVRRNNPDAWIIYKPHPDVVAGNRKGVVLGDYVRFLANETATDANIIDCINVSDEIHTMTSLSGFEALLFEKTVHCYGAPFYAGWGLTVDHVSHPLRRRRIALEELVFISLCEYPCYRMPGTLGFCRVEDVVDWLYAVRMTTDGKHPSSTWGSRRFRKLLHMGSSILGRKW